MILRLAVSAMVLAFMPIAALAQSDPAPEEVLVVYGRGESRQTQTVTHQDLASLTPGSSPIKAVAHLPGVSIQTSDPFGAYEWAVRISVRGFTQNQLGFTLDGVPLGDMTYNNFNGLHVSRAIIAEDLDHIALRQGAGGLDVASSSNLGGTLDFISVDPAPDFGASASASVGSDNAWRGFARLEAGMLPSGGRGYLAASHQTTDKWKGSGRQSQLQINAKFVQPIGQATLTSFLNYSDRQEDDYQDLSLKLINRLGYDLDNIGNDWTTAVAIANAYQHGQPLPAPYQTVDDAYFDAAGLRQDLVGASRLDVDVARDLRLKVMAYLHHDDGQGHWDTPYVPSTIAGAGLAPISMSSQEYRIRRYGVTASLRWSGERHEIEGGGWYEHNAFANRRVFYALDATGLNRDIYAFQSDPFLVQFDRRYAIETLSLHLQDTWRVTDRLKAEFGFRTLRVATDVVSLSGTPVINGEIVANRAFLPQAGVNYRFDERSEVFADYARNMRAFTIAPFKTTQAGFDAIRGRLQPEIADTFELGWRFHTGPLETLLAGYAVKFHNRLLTTFVGPAIVGNPQVLSNVGSITSRGLEAAGSWRVSPAWTVTGSYSFNDARYDDDVTDSSGAVITRSAGKQVVDAPRHIASVSLNYDSGRVFGSLSGNVQSRRFYTYLNDSPVAGRFLTDLELGYRLPRMGPAKEVELQVNVTNLLDKRYISTIGELGFIDSDPTGSYQSVLAGAPRAVFVTLRGRL